MGWWVSFFLEQTIVISVSQLTSNTYPFANSPITPTTWELQNSYIMIDPATRLKTSLPTSSPKTLCSHDPPVGRSAWIQEPGSDQWESIKQEVQFLGCGTFNTIRIELLANEDSASSMTVECQTPWIAGDVPTHMCLQCFQQPSVLVILLLCSNMPTLSWEIHWAFSFLWALGFNNPLRKVKPFALPTSSGYEPLVAPAIIPFREEGVLILQNCPRLQHTEQPPAHQSKDKPTNDMTYAHLWLCKLMGKGCWRLVWQHKCIITGKKQWFEIHTSWLFC